uniref:Serendipity locus protein H-1 n=1 Tax=Cacopsylla melanoneura TaxID=428564 RepID=A0A8D9BMI8_9HEMI
MSEDITASSVNMTYHETNESLPGSVENFGYGYPYPMMYPTHYAQDQTQLTQQPCEEGREDDKDYVMTSLDSRPAAPAMGGMDLSTVPMGGMDLSTGQYQYLPATGQVPSYGDIDSYCNYFQSFFKPQQDHPFSNHYLNMTMERPLSPMQAEDYTIEDLSNKPLSTSSSFSHQFNENYTTDGGLDSKLSFLASPQPTSPPPAFHSSGGYTSPQPFQSPGVNLGYMCDICKEGFKSAKGLSNHRAAIHSEGREYACKFCAKRFNTPGHLSRHEERHFQKINMSCFLCDTHFKTVSNFKFHLFSTHILSTAHTEVFNVQTEPKLEPIIFESTFIHLEMEGSVTDDHLKIIVKGKLSDHIKLYQSHFSSQSTTPFIQVIFHKNCSKLMTVTRITATQFTLVLVPQTQVLMESRLTKKNSKVISFEVDIIAKMCVFVINSQLVVLLKDGAATYQVPVRELKIIA